MLLEREARAGLTEELYEQLIGDANLLRDVASDLLAEHFPDTLHEEILTAVGRDFAVSRAVRNALFRQEVLVAYGYCCAVCGFDARLGDSLIDIEAAHIRWQPGGRAEEGPQRTGHVQPASRPVRPGRLHPSRPTIVSRSPNS